MDAQIKINSFLPFFLTENEGFQNRHIKNVDYHRIPTFGSKKKLHQKSIRRQTRLYNKITVVGGGVWMCFNLFGRIAEFVTKSTKPFYFQKKNCVYMKGKP